VSDLDDMVAIAFEHLPETPGPPWEQPTEDFYDQMRHAPVTVKLGMIRQVTDPRTKAHLRERWGL
jgi:hypothetical protein